MARQATNEPGLFVYGHNVVRELLASGHPVDALHVLSPRDESAALAARAGIRVIPADRGALDRLTRGALHQGVVATVGVFRYWELQDLMLEAAGPILILDGVQDPRNFGAILRTARAAGASGVVIPRDRSVAVTSVVAAASAGHVFGIRIGRVTNVARALGSLKAAGWWTVALSGVAEESIFDREFPHPLAIVLGGEGGGVRPLVERSCDYRCAIPMAPGVDSLNVSVAAGIALYELGVRPRSPIGGA